MKRRVLRYTIPLIRLTEGAYPGGGLRLCTNSPFGGDPYGR
ncbi:MAG: hypothetical protein R3C05_05965 [Pirellulaceae bacterium]